MTEWPALCTSGKCRHPDRGGPRRTEQAWFCPVCIDHLRDNLDAIATMWPDLQAGLGAATGHSSADDGKQHNGRVNIGLVINETVSDAMSAATEHAWFLTRTILAIANQLGRTITVPTEPDTPTLTAWIAARHVDWLTTKTGRLTALTIIENTHTIHRQARNAAYPRFTRRVPTGLPCEAKDDQGAPCPGLMVAHLRDTYDGMPDLTCTTNRDHTMPPDVWEREGWKRRHRDMAPGAATRLAQAIVSA